MTHVHPKEVDGEGGHQHAQVLVVHPHGAQTQPARLARSNQDTWRKDMQSPRAQTNLTF